MACIFCLGDGPSTAREHVIPESLGNTDHVLSPGAVCDRCNNYFATHLERQVLEAPFFRDTRGWLGIPNKRGKSPWVEGVSSAGCDVDLRLSGKAGPVVAIGDWERFRAKHRSGGSFFFPVLHELPERTVLARFLAKTSLEAHTLRWLQDTGGLYPSEVAADLDELRRFARYGLPTNWPIATRKIYESEDSDGLGQILHEFDFLYSTAGELFFVLAIFGLELCINMGGPEITGYTEWLQGNGYVSPLYSGKNSGASLPRGQR